MWFFSSFFSPCYYSEGVVGGEDWNLNAVRSDMKNLHHAVPAPPSPRCLALECQVVLRDCGVWFVAYAKAWESSVFLESVSCPLIAVLLQVSTLFQMTPETKQLETNDWMHGRALPFSTGFRTIIGVQKTPRVFHVASNLRQELGCLVTTWVSFCEVN